MWGIKLEILLSTNDPSYLQVSVAWGQPPLTSRRPYWRVDGGVNMDWKYWRVWNMSYVVSNLRACYPQLSFWTASIDLLEALLEASVEELIKHWKVCYVGYQTWDLVIHKCSKLFTTPMHIVGSLYWLLRGFIGGLNGVDNKVLKSMSCGESNLRTWYPQFIKAINRKAYIIKRQSGHISALECLI